MQGKGKFRWIYDKNTWINIQPDDVFFNENELDYFEG